jgi:hypothetical protein
MSATSDEATPAFSEIESAGVRPPPPSAAASRWSTDRIVSLSAMAVGICSLFITLYQTYLTRQAQSASVLPYLAFGITSNDDGAFVTLRNDGLGPARLESVRVHFRGKTSETDPYDFFLKHHAGPMPAGLSVDRLTPGRLLPAGAVVPMVGVSKGTDRVAVLGEMLRLFALTDAPPSWLVELGAQGGDKAVIDVVYTSVYGERWRVRSDGQVPQRE